MSRTRLSDERYDFRFAFWGFDGASKLETVGSILIIGTQKGGIG